MSNVRELCRTSFIDIDETYAVWYPSSWGTLDNAIGDIVDTFDSEDNFTPGWETYDITEVVKDSLGTERNKVNFVLKLRDETKSYNRLVRYYGDVETDTVDLSNYTDERIELFPTVTVVYRTPVSINETSKIRSNFTGPGSVKVFSANGRLLREVTISSNTSNALLLESLGLTQGVYVIQKKVGGVVQTGKCAIR